MEGRIADPVLAAQPLRPQPSLVFLQDSNDLFFAETTYLHRLSPHLENRLTSIQGHFRGAGHELILPRPECIAQRLLGHYSGQ